jgi:hypothetical protein
MSAETVQRARSVLSMIGIALNPAAVFAVGLAIASGLRRGWIRL